MLVCHSLLLALSSLHPFPEPQGFLSRCPSGPVPHNISRLCLKACINKRKQSAPLRAWSSGDARGCASACVVGPPPGQVRPPPRPPGQTLPPPPDPSVKARHSWLCLDRCLCLEVKGRVWHGNLPRWAVRPSSVQLWGKGWGDIMASSVEGCSLNFSRARPPSPFRTGPCPSPFLERDPASSPRGLWRLGPLGQNHGGKAFQSKNSSWSSSPCQPPDSS